MLKTLFIMINLLDMHSIEKKNILGLSKHRSKLGQWEWVENIKTSCVHFCVLCKSKLQDYPSLKLGRNNIRKHI